MKLSVSVLFVLFSFTLQSQNSLKTTLKFPGGEGVEKFEKVEIGVNFPPEIKNQVDAFLGDSTIGLNPYDSWAIDLTAEWISPSGKTQKVNGFFYQDYRRKTDKKWSPIQTENNWLLRWSPDEVGVWTIKTTLNANGKSWVSSLLTFSCIEGDSKGYLTVNPSKPNGNKMLYLAESDEPFFALGHNIAHGGHGYVKPVYADYQKQWLTELAESKGNFWRFEFGMNNYLPSGYNCKNYTEKLAPFCDLDDIVDLSDRLDLQFIAFRHHVEMQTGQSWEKVRWDKNGYVQQLKLPKRIDYFTSPEALKWQKNELRYIMARWGYSKSFNFFGYSELEGWVGPLSREEGISEIEALAIFNKWFSDQRSYIENELEMDRMLFANTFSLSRLSDQSTKMSPELRGLYDTFLSSDIVGYHSYGRAKNTNLRTVPKYAKYFKEHWDKPTILEEVGLNLPHMYCATDNNFITTIWSSSFYGDFGCGMHYWWDRGIHYNNFQKLYEPLSNFMARIDYTKPFENYNDYDKSIKKSKIAYYSTVFPESNEVYGYLTDPSHFWLNMTAENENLDQYLNDGAMKNPCIMTDGHELGKPLVNENAGNAENEKDAYTDKARVTPMTADNYGSETIKVEGLERTGLFGKKKSYIIEYYNPRDPLLEVLKTETIEAKRNGSLKLTLDKSNWPAAAFYVKGE
jgi:hypothetical protein